MTYQVSLYTMQCCELYMVSQTDNCELYSSCPRVFCQESVAKIVQNLLRNSSRIHSRRCVIPHPCFGKQWIHPMCPNAFHGLLYTSRGTAKRISQWLHSGFGWSMWPVGLPGSNWCTMLRQLIPGCQLQHRDTVYPKKYAHGFCFAVLCCGYTLTDFPISIRLTSLALWQSNDCLSASKATLMHMDKYFMRIHYERLHNHNKAKHNKTVCIFLGIYCTHAMALTWQA